MNFPKEVIEEVKKEGKKLEHLITEEEIAQNRKDGFWGEAMDIVQEFDSFNIKRGKEVWSYEAGSEIVDEWIEKNYPRWQKESKDYDKGIFHIFINSDKDFLDFNEDSATNYNCYDFAF